MSARILTRNDRVQQLRAAYKEAFDEWAFATTRLQMLIRTHEPGAALAEARSRVAAAYTKYRDSRNQLAESLVENRTAPAIRLCIVPAQNPPAKTEMSAVHQ